MAAQSAQAAPASGSAAALVVRAGSLINTHPLSFGAIIPGSSSGTVTVDILGNRTTSGGVTAAGGFVSAARFVGLDLSFPYTAVVQAPTPTSITLTRAGGSQTMTVNNLVIESGPGNYTTPPNVPFLVRVGGRLTVGANQATGLYTGTFSVTVNYM